MSSLKLTFFGEQDEIGGNKILFEHKYKMYFAKFFQPRKCNALFDFMEFDLISKINGIYRRDYCLHCSTLSRKTFAFNKNI